MYCAPLEIVLSMANVGCVYRISFSCSFCRDLTVAILAQVYVRSIRAEGTSGFQILGGSRQEDHCRSDYSYYSVSSLFSFYLHRRGKILDYC